MHRRLVSLLAGCVLLLAAEVKADPVELYGAFRKGWVTVNARSENGYKSVRMTIQNRTSRRLRIDPSGSYLVPQGRRCQRLGLGPPLVKKGSGRGRYIDLAPRGRWSGLVGACCMDEKRSGPGSGQGFNLASRRSPRRIYQALKFWGDHPQIAQSAVNSVVWGNSSMPALESALAAHPDPEPSEQDRRLSRSELLCGGGRLLWRSGLGELYSRDAAKGPWKLLDRDVENIALGGGQVVSYVPTLSSLRVYNATQRRWVLVPLPIAPAQVLPAPGGKIYVLDSDGHVYLTGPGHDGFVQSLGAAVSHLAVTSRPVSPVVFVLNRHSGQVSWSRDDLSRWRKIRGTGIGDVKASATSLYSQSRKGIYRFYKKWEKIAGPGSDILPGRFVCFLRRDKSLWLYSETTKGLCPLPSLPDSCISLTVDAIADELYRLDDDGKIWRLTKGSWTEAGSVPIPVISGGTKKSK